MVPHVPPTMPDDATNAAVNATPPPRQRRGMKVSAVIASPLEYLTPKKEGFVHGPDKVPKTHDAMVAEVAEFIDTLADRGRCVSVHKDLTRASIYSLLQK